MLQEQCCCIFGFEFAYFLSGRTELIGPAGSHRIRASERWERPELLLLHLQPAATNGQVTAYGSDAIWAATADGLWLPNSDYEWQTCASKRTQDG